MIPIRNFPYTDYHDLNLDFLLRQFQIFEADLEELKRRVKALEDWRVDIVEPDLITIKADIRDIKGDIISLGDRITNVEGDIVTINNTIDVLAGNSKTFYFVIDTNDVVTIREADPDNGTIIDLTDSDTFRAFEERLLSAASTKGEINDRYFVKDLTLLHGDSGYYYEGRLQTEPNHNYIAFYSMRNTYLKEIKIRITSTPIVDRRSQGIQSAGVYKIPVAAWEPSGNADYPYKNEYNILGPTASSVVDVYFNDMNSFLAYSGIICEFVKVENARLTFYAKSIPNDDFYVTLSIKGGTY